MVDEGDDGGGGSGGSVGVGGSGGGFTGWSVGLVGRAIGRSVQVAAVTTTTKTTTTATVDECARVRAYDGMRGKLGLRGATAAWHRRLRDERESCALSTHSRDYILLVLSYPRTAHALRAFRTTCVHAYVAYLPTYRRKLARMHSAPHHSTSTLL